MTNTRKMAMTDSLDSIEFRRKILKWYDSHRRVLPWRALPGETPEPYRVWLSEVMLQQTTVPAVIPYFLKFLEKWPDVQALATADAQDIMNAWAGLGYYARARNLHKCAKAVTEVHNGVFPATQDGLMKLPGIGDYTSAAIMSIAFGKPATVVDGNVERVMARYFAVKEPLPGAKKTLKALAHSLSDGQTERPGDYAQALMDLGAGICTPKSPLCALCPLNATCEGYAADFAADLPYREKKAGKPQKVGYVYWISDRNGRILMHKRPEKGMLGGMYGLPTSEWVLKGELSGDNHLPFLKMSDITIHQAKGAAVRHSFTHFDLELYLFCVAKAGKISLPPGYSWREEVEIHGVSFPTVFKKAYVLFSERKAA